MAGCWRKGMVIKMEREIIFELGAIYRDNFRVTGFHFGGQRKSACIVGAMRGNENQQLYACSLLIQKLRELEENGKLSKEHGILVIPCVNPFSMNVKKRFWTIDNTDINRMFPGYDQGETTQRIAAGIFDVAKDYEYGMQFASFYMPGAFMPHVRMMKTGLEDVELACQFGLPYVVLHNPRPFDTTTLNYNWQIWETKAFSIYTTNTARVDKKSAREAVEAILNFLSQQGIVRYHRYRGYRSRVIESSSMIPVRTAAAGFFESKVDVGEEVLKGQLLAVIQDVYTAEIIGELHSPVDGVVAFMHDDPMTYANTAVFKIIEEETW